MNLGYYLGRFKGIVFDLDGTLVKTEVDFRQLKREMIAELERNGMPSGVMTPDKTTVAILEFAKKAWDDSGKSEAGWVPIDAEMTRLMDAAEMRALGTLEVIPGASEAVRRLHSMGYRLGILTRSNHTYAEEAVRKMGLVGQFDVVFGRGDTSQPKPYAEAMYESAQVMKLDLDEVFLVGDNQIDHACAVNAKCHFVGVSSGPRGEKSWEGNRPGVLLPSVADLPDYILTHGE